MSGLRIRHVRDSDVLGGANAVHALGGWYTQQMVKLGVVGRLLPMGSCALVLDNDMHLLRPVSVEDFVAPNTTGVQQCFTPLEWSAAHRQWHNWNAEWMHVPPPGEDEEVLAVTPVTLSTTVAHAMLEFVDGLGASHNPPLNWAAFLRRVRFTEYSSFYMFARHAGL